MIDWLRLKTQEVEIVHQHCCVYLVLKDVTATFGPFVKYVVATASSSRGLETTTGWQSGIHITLYIADTWGCYILFIQGMFLNFYRTC